MGGADDVDAAVAAAKAAFETFSLTTREERLALLDSIIGVYAGRMDELGRHHQPGDGRAAVAGAGRAGRRRPRPPRDRPRRAGRLRVRAADGHHADRARAGRRVRDDHALELAAQPDRLQGRAGARRRLHDGAQAVRGRAAERDHLRRDHRRGRRARRACSTSSTATASTSARRSSAHPDVDMVSFTGSTRAGIEVARAAAPTVKRVAQELGGKSANIILDDADFEAVIARDMAGDVHQLGPVVQRADPHARARGPDGRGRGDRGRGGQERRRRRSPRGRRATSARSCPATQYGRIQQLIEKGIGEGAKLEVGGPGKPDGLETGYYVQPTVFSHVSNDMTIAREEIFGPVLVMIGYEDDDDAVRIANDTAYGLSGYISGERRPRQARWPGASAAATCTSTAPRRLQRAVRRLQAVRQRPRVGAPRLRGVPRDQGHPGLRRLTAAAVVAADG